MNAREDWQNAARLFAARSALTAQERVVANLQLRLAVESAKLPALNKELSEATAAPINAPLDLAELVMGIATVRRW